MSKLSRLLNELIPPPEWQLTHNRMTGGNDDALIRTGLGDSPIESSPIVWNVGGSFSSPVVALKPPCFPENSSGRLILVSKKSCPLSGLRGLLENHASAPP